MNLGWLRHPSARLKWWLAILVWLCAVTVPIVWVAYNEFLGDLACERLDSEYGELSWSRLPPGRVCRFEAEPDYGLPAETIGPSPMMSVYLVALACGAIGLVRVRPRSE